ncbi:class II glycyl-tRNA synthetase [Fadolivirus algeromassiliense]|jgi:glycyl-tRNA synthetase|uniref:glycine--tRNA ligase n=1 Tax=Fadolivirus FV1/VV64 TaxID=3070911 RepID=A0A7D3R261_9VIRU|nr:class II glycyl-tRNA synthetase [Fadolivirus algeromassiliense]QKF94238.1 class II glycyl-tRNA synthetase [Fadolivirus FV1/VV64]
MNKQQKLKTCLQENHYILPSYQAYGGFSGYQDYGILGSRVKNKLLEVWRNMFVNDYNDTIVEIETPNVMLYDILKASGHVDRFTDYVVYDEAGVCYRADHLVKNWFKSNNLNQLADKVDAMDLSQLEFNINKYKMLSKPESKHNLPYKVEKKNLMFEVASTANPNGIDFLRPEQAQGIFVNFKNCQQFLQREPPFGIAQIGRSYRKEISPQQFTRMREFTQAEIEYFVDPLNKNHDCFDDYKTIKIPLMTSTMQTKNDQLPCMITIDEAVDKKLISHKLMAYFLAKIYVFALKIGLKEEKLRFRQHMPHEMSHYASECWDLETFVNGDWLECVGTADRGCYDLQSHTQNSNTQFKAKRILEKPLIYTQYRVKLDMKQVSSRYKELASKILQYYNNLSQNDIQNIKNSLVKDDDTTYVCIDDTICVLTKDMIRIEEEKKSTTFEEYIPHVIEPSFGIDRLIYSIFEQNFWARENDDQRIVLSLPNILVPYDVAVFALSKNDKLNPVVTQIRNTLSGNGFKCYMDNSSTNIGKRYARVDEMGIKYVITVDFDTLDDNQVTIRERDSMNQIRIPIEKILESLSEIN